MVEFLIIIGGGLCLLGCFIAVLEFCGRPILLLQCNDCSKKFGVSLGRLRRKSKGKGGTLVKCPKCKTENWLASEDIPPMPGKNPEDFLRGVAFWLGIRIK